MVGCEAVESNLWRDGVMRRSLLASLRVRVEP